MNIHPHIVNDVKIRHLSEKIKDLQEVFAEITYSHLPVEKDGTYLGCLSENDVQCFEAEKTIGDYQYALEGFFVRNTDDGLEVLNTFAQHDTNVLPVLDEKNVYMGIIELNEIVNVFSETTFVSEPGGIILLEKGYRDYSFSEITQIIESNGAHPLGIFLSKLENDLAQLTVKVNVTNLNAILQSFRRYGYKIVSHHQEDTFQTNLRERSDYLEKYLNV